MTCNHRLHELANAVNWILTDSWIANSVCIVELFNMRLLRLLRRLAMTRTVLANRKLNAMTPRATGSEVSIAFLLWFAMKIRVKGIIPLRSARQSLVKNGLQKAKRSFAPSTPSGVLCKRQFAFLGLRSRGLLYPVRGSQWRNEQSRFNLYRNARFTRNSWR